MLHMNTEAIFSYWLIFLRYWIKYMKVVINEINPVSHELIGWLKTSILVKMLITSLSQTI